MPFNPHELTIDTIKGFVDRLAKHLKTLPVPKSWPPKRSELNEAMARALGFAHWHALKQTVDGKPHQEVGVALPLPGNSFIRNSGREGETASNSIRVFDQHNRSFVAVIGTANDRDRFYDDAVEALKGPLLWIRNKSSKATTQSFTMVATDGGELFDVINILGAQKKDHELNHALCSMMDIYDSEQSWISADAISIETGALLAALIPALMTIDSRTGKRPITTRLIRENLSLESIISMTGRRDMPWHLSLALMSYLDRMQLPGMQAARLPRRGDSHALFHEDEVAQFYDRKKHSIIEKNATRLLEPAIHAHTPIPTTGRIILEIDTPTSECPYASFLPETRWWLLHEYLKLWIEVNPKGVVIFDNLPDDIALAVTSITGMAGCGSQHPNLRGILVGADDAFGKMPSWFQNPTGIRDIHCWIGLGGVSLPHR